MFYYGTNLLNHTPIICDRSDMTNAPQHRAIFGTLGSGRHFLMQSEIAQVTNETNDIVYVLDFGRNFINTAYQLNGDVVPVIQSKTGGVDAIKIPNKSNFVVLDASPILYAKDCRENAIYMCLVAMWEQIEAAIKNENSKRRFWLYIDEILPIFRSANTQIFYTMIKRGKTHNCNITYTNPSINDFCKNEYGKAVLENTPILTLLNQTHEDRKCLSELYNLSSEELSFLTEVPCYNGLFCANGDNTPFIYYRKE